MWRRSRGVLSVATGVVVSTIVAIGANAAGAVTDPAIIAIDEFIEGQAVDKTQPDWRTSLTIPPVLPFVEGETYVWLLETSAGVLSFRLFPEVAPLHVSSAIYLTRLGFYDELTFHRVVPGFMAQGGDPVGNGSGGPGYSFGGEFDPEVVHDARGVLSTANAGINNNTDGS